MGGIFPNRGNFVIPTAIIDEYNYVMDGFIDGKPGKSCLLVYPPNKEECPNCFLDPNTGRSTDTYKPGGPEPFTNFTVCPHCGGEGYKTTPNTESINLRVYYNPKEWVNTGTTFTVDDGVIQVIGYMSDYPKLQKAIALITNKELQGVETWKYKKEGGGVPWGLDQRYVVQYWRIIK